MKLLELKIQNIRGIPDLTIKPGGKSIVIYGPNGSGKSGVVDAIDFLLTGQISRLVGEGTKGIDIQKHGPHITCSPEEAVVSAKIDILGNIVDLSRRIQNPDKLVASANSIDCLDPVLDFASRGMHVLTRRNLLRFITATAGDRSTQIQALLNIAEIEKIRSALKSATGDLKRECSFAERSVKDCEQQIIATAQIPNFDEASILQVVNRSRDILGGGPILRLSAEELKTGITYLAQSSAVSISSLQTYMDNIFEALSIESVDNVTSLYAELCDVLTELRSNPDLFIALNRKELIDLGIELIDESGSCPLCDTPWEPGSLLAYLEKRKKSASDASHFSERINKLAGALVNIFGKLRASLQSIAASIDSLGISDQSGLLNLWVSNLQSQVGMLGNPISCSFGTSTSNNQFCSLFVPDGSGALLESIKNAITEKSKNITPQQVAWDQLTRLEGDISHLENARSNYSKADLYFQRADILLRCYVLARDAILDKLYNDVRDRFVYFYRQLHIDDESNFDAVIEPKQASLDLKVDFFGYGLHPPHALHSEGHQDSMGLCLYLTIAEKLTSNILDLIILDDVVMSVDSGHRGAICHVLKEAFPDRQFLITTHDETWARQLRTAEVSSASSTVRFYGWSVESGPKLTYSTDMWQQTDDFLEKEDIPNAALSLRRGLGQFFEQVCDSLRAPIPYRSNANWNEGEFGHAAIKQYKALIGAAKNSANARNDKAALERLKIIDEASSSAIHLSQVEFWAVNSSIHYNKWLTLTKNDFRPIVKAFRDLHDVFFCKQCNSLLSLEFDADKPIAIKCRCNVTNWILLGK